MGRSIFESMNPMAVPAQQPGPMSGARQFANPIEQANFIMQTLTNPAAFVRQQFPDIPEDISNDPNQILKYLQQSRGISDQTIQRLQQQMGGR